MFYFSNCWLDIFIRLGQIGTPQDKLGQFLLVASAGYYVLHMIMSDTKSDSDYMSREVLI